MSVIEFPGIFKRLFREKGESLIIKEPVVPILEGGGLAYEEEGSGIYVDFDTMDTTRFENMLKALTIPIYITGNKPFYVNWQTGSDDTSVEGIGESTDVPFKTIQACIDYVTTYYNVNSHYITIYIASGTYDEQLSCGEFSRTTGYICLMPLDGEYTVTVSKTTTGDLVSISGGNWQFYNMIFSLNAQAADTSSGAPVWHYVVTANNGIATVCDCVINGADVSSGNGEDHLFLLSVSDGAYVAVKHSSGSRRELNLTNNGRFTSVLAAVACSHMGYIYLHGNNTSADNAKISVSGAYTYVLYAWGNSLISFGGNGVYAPTVVNKSGSTCTGRKWYVNSGAAISGGQAGAQAGSTDGSIDTSTYCWVN